MQPDFVGFPKIYRLSREIIVTEKIDGTNAQIYITEDGEVFAGSRTRWITPQADNFGFATWVEGNKDSLRTFLGPGQHFGEWWGKGIQRGYGMQQKLFSLFNTSRWSVNNELITTPWPEGVRVVPVLYQGMFSQGQIDLTLLDLQNRGSSAAPGFMDPEGIVIFHTASQTSFKKTIKGDEVPKGTQAKIEKIMGVA